MEIAGKFFHKYYNDDEPRRLIFGINPGRFGAGVTGVNFTAPRQLKECCGIDHPFKMQSELSAEFIYSMINAYGGPDIFYKKFFITSISPLGFVKDGININYYDDPVLFKTVKPFIVKSIQQQLELSVDREMTFCIGGDKNLKFFSQLNDEFGFFEKIIPLPHPRFIMQYRRKKVDEYISLYLNVLR